MSKPAKSTHKSLQRAVAILRLFSEQEPALTVTQVSQKLDIHKSTVSRILSVLLEEGLLDFDAEVGKYSPGVGLVTLAGVALGRIDVRAASLASLETLAQRSEETITVSVLRENETVAVAYLPSPQSVRYVAWLGRRVRLHNTASGRLFLADFERPARQSYFWSQNLVRLMQDNEFDEKLTQISLLGFALEVDEFEEGISAIAAPVFDYRHELKAAVSIAGPTYRLSTKKLNALIKPLQAEAHAISEKLGFVGVYPYQKREEKK